MDVEVNHKLPSSQVFEKIKRKLYIRSSHHVADQAVVVATKLVVKKDTASPTIASEKGILSNDGTQAYSRQIAQCQRQIL